MNQLAAENRKSETIVRKVKEQAAKKLSLWIKSIAPKVGGMLAAVALILAVVALPTLSMVTIIYNSPLAIFFPPVEEGDTVQSVIQTYEQEFHRTVEELASTHPGHDEGELVYVDYEGTGGAPSNLYDMIAVYMVKYGVGETDTKKDSDTSKDTATTAAKQTYILNTNTKKFHKPGCRSVKQMSEKNKKEVKDTRDHIIADGYDPCKICDP